MSRFFAIRMIVLKPGEDLDVFQTWMTQSNGLLDEMWDIFKSQGLEKITFLRGAEQAKGRAVPGANANFAWITYWTSENANDTAWKSDRPDSWHSLWDTFMKKCLQPPAKPTHPPYDGGSKDHGNKIRGYGSLVAGFEEVQSWKRRP